MATIISGDQINDEGAWTKLRLETWIKGSDPMASLAALLTPQGRSLLGFEGEVPDQITLDGFALFEVAAHLPAWCPHGRRLSECQVCQSNDTA